MSNIINDYNVAGREISLATIANIDLALGRNCQLAGTGVCDVCPNNKINKVEDEILMSTEMLQNICDQLAEVNYKGLISLQRYNEPFVRGDLSEMIKVIRRTLPEVRIGMNTNGFLVTAEKLRSVYEAGLSQMNFQLYPVTAQEKAEFTFDWAHEKAQKFCQKLGIKIDESKTIIVDGYYYEFTIILPGEWNTPCEQPTMTMYAKRLSVLGCDRGGSIKELSKTRTSPCHHVGKFLGIDSNGDVSPCTNITGACLGIKNHAKMILGNVKKNSLQEIFSRVEPMRKALQEDFSEESLKTYSVCAKCTFKPHMVQMEELMNSSK